MLGFTGSTSDVRIAQYESEARTPKQHLVNQLAEILEVNPQAIQTPNIDTCDGVMHTLFALEDEYGFEIQNIDGRHTITLSHEYWFGTLDSKLKQWARQARFYREGKISKEEYDNWRYNYPLGEAEFMRRISGTSQDSDAAE